MSQTLKEIAAILVGPKVKRDFGCVEIDPIFEAGKQLLEELSTQAPSETTNLKITKIVLGTLVSTVSFFDQRYFYMDIGHNERYYPLDYRTIGSMLELQSIQLLNDVNHEEWTKVEQNNALIEKDNILTIGDAVCMGVLPFDKNKFIESFPELQSTISSLFDEVVLPYIGITPNKMELTDPNASKTFQEKARLYHLVQTVISEFHRAEEAEPSCYEAWKTVKESAELLENQLLSEQEISAEKLARITLGVMVYATSWVVQKYKSTSMIAISTDPSSPFYRVQRYPLDYRSITKLLSALGLTPNTSFEKANSITIIQLIGTAVQNKILPFPVAEFKAIFPGLASYIDELAINIEQNSNEKDTEASELAQLFLPFLTPKKIPNNNAYNQFSKAVRDLSYLCLSHPDFNPENSKVIVDELKQLDGLAQKGELTEEAVHNFKTKMHDISNYAPFRDAIKIIATILMGLTLGFMLGGIAGAAIGGVSAGLIASGSCFFYRRVTDPFRPVVDAGNACVVTL